MLKMKELYFKGELKKQAKKEAKKEAEKAKQHPSYCIDGVLYVYDKKLGDYVAEHDAEDDMLNMFDD